MDLSEGDETVRDSRPPDATEAAPKHAQRGTLALAARGPRRAWLLLALVALLVGVGLGAYALLTAGTETTDDAQVTADVVPLAARVSGTVIQVAIAENQSVKQGDLIARLDDRDYAAALKQSQAALASARARADAADAQVSVVEASSRGGLSSARARVSGSTVAVATAQAQVAAAKAALSRAEADQRKAQLELERARRLRAANAVPQEQLDNARIGHDVSLAAVQQAKAQLVAAREAIAAARSRVSEARGQLSQRQPVDAQIASARAAAELAHTRVQEAQVAVELAQLKLSYTRVVAPADGRASTLTVHPGQLVQPGQPIVELVPHHTYLVANFKETQIGWMRAGQRARVHLDAFGGREFAGRVASLAGGTGSTFALIPPDNASGNFVKVVQRVPVRIEWVNLPADLKLRAGFSADVTVYLK